MEDYAFKDKAKKFEDKFEADRVRLMYMWVKQGTVSLKQFTQLMEIHCQRVEFDTHAMDAFKNE